MLIKCDIKQPSKNDVENEEWFTFAFYYERRARLSKDRHEETLFKAVAFGSEAIENIHVLDPFFNFPIPPALSQLLSPS